MFEQFGKQGAMAVWVQERHVAADSMDEIDELQLAVVLAVRFEALHRLE